ncbi:MAG TPA: tRNA 2-thiouridine(34) synthase MnmA [Gammaproteobacteria bacterium]|nr:tRNA 2-thiouridine(34) synthase MnmA [Gammaproteobacteria bacterium]
MLIPSRIIVGLSGGVDSAVAALLLVEQGHRVEGLFMDNWDDDDGYCTAAEDFQDARQVAETLGIPLHRADFAAEYRERVFAHFLEAHRRGLTPNPDVLCNSEIKFKAFLDHARRLGAERIATGHYARLKRDGDGVTLLRAADAAKDQSYFLHAVDSTALAQAVFPVGDLQKREVRTEARAAGFDNFDKKDSTGICFIGERRFREFLERFLPTAPGDMVTPDGEVIGRHQGLAFYTLGQRQGLGIGGRRDTSDAPWYVAAKDMPTNRLIVAQGHDHPLLFSEGLRASALHWIAGAPPAESFRCTAKIRYRQADQPCRVDTDGESANVRFETPQRAVTPGQYCVFYDGEVCLGGGVIEKAEAADATALPRNDASRANGLAIERRARLL